MLIHREIKNYIKYIAQCERKETMLRKSSLMIIALIIHFTPSSIFKTENQFEVLAGVLTAKTLAIENISRPDTISLQKTMFYGTSRINTVVFGFLPEWMLNTARKYLKYNLLTHIAVFPFTVKISGDLSFPSDWPWTDIINNAHLNDVKVILTAFSDDMNIIHNLLTNERAKLHFFENIKKTLASYNMDGVNIDFESLKEDDKGSRINNFMSELTGYLHEQIPGCEVSIAGPAVNWDGLWDLAGLAASCDYIFVMSYCYFGSWSKASGPPATLTGRKYSIDSTFTNLQTGYGEVISKNPKKLILGVPYYSNHWITESSEPHSPVIEFLGNLTYDEVMNLSSNYHRIWHEIYQVPYYITEINGTWHQLWYDGPVSIGLKFDYAKTKQIRGVGIWALGYDRNRKELWNLIDEKFSIRDTILLAEKETPEPRDTILVVATEQEIKVKEIAEEP